MPSPSTETLLQAALALPEEEREYLSLRLADSLADDEEMLSDEQAAEISRRAHAVRAGEAVLIPADRAFKEAYAALARFRE